MQLSSPQLTPIKNLPRMRSSYDVTYLENAIAVAAMMPTMLLTRRPPFRPNLLATQPPMKPPHMPPMAKMDTAMAYMNVEAS